MELSGSVIGQGTTTGTSNDNLTTIKFTVKNAIAGNPIDLTPCDGTTNATNKCVISLTTAKEYKNNIKWTTTFIGDNNGNALLETGEQCEITVDLTAGGLGTVAGDLDQPSAGQ